LVETAAPAAPAFLAALPLPEALFPPFALDLDFLFEPDLAALDDLLTPFFFPFF
jgi:hypothetical protein